jgi:hypothetical protein
MALRTRFLAAAVFFLIAGMCAPTLELLGVDPQVALWATRFCGYTFLCLLGAYYFAYRRQRSEAPLQFSLAMLFVVTALGALLAWATPGGNRTLVAAIVIEGLLVYWRCWMRRHEPLSYLGGAVLLLLILHLGFCLMLAGFWATGLV